MNGHENEPTTAKRQSAATAESVARALLTRFADEAAPAPPAASAAAPSPESSTAPSIDYRRTRQLLRWHDALFRVYDAAAAAQARQNLANADDEDGELLRVCGEVHRMLLRHPVAAKSAYAALVAEGRRFALTADGAELQSRLRGSRRMQRAAMLWRSITMGMLSDADEATLPSTYLDNLLHASARVDLERVLARLASEEP